MKHILPVKQYEGAVAYPAVDRRGFLRGLAVGLGTAAAGLTLGASPARASTRQRVVLRLGRRVELRGCDYQVDRVEGFTEDARLATFLGDARETGGTESVVVRLLGAATCADVVDRKRLSALEGRLAAAVQAHYRARTRRTAGALVLTLFLTRVSLPPPGVPPLPARP
jgi:hypothetical protein